MQNQTNMLLETEEAPTVIARQLKHNRQLVKQISCKLSALDPPFVATCARGTSGHVGTYAKYLIEIRLGIPVYSFPPSIVSLYKVKLNLKGSVFFLISQSGKSPDLLSVAEAARDGGAYTVAIVNDLESPLAGLVDDVIPVGAGVEKSVAATKSCLGSMSTACHLCSVWGNDLPLMSALDRLPEDLEAAMACDWSQGVSELKGAHQMLLISRGIGLAGVQEAALKLRETCRIQAEAFSAAEVKHGPMAIVGKGFPVLIVSTFDATQSSINEVAQLFIERGASVFSAGSSYEGATMLNIHRTENTLLQPIAFLQSFYRFSNSLAVGRGFNPDRPRFLQKVTQTI